MTVAESRRSIDREAIERRVSTVLERLASGRLAGIVDAGRRGGERSLMVTGEAATTANVRGLMSIGGGLAVLGLPPERFDALELHTLDASRDRGAGWTDFGMPFRARRASASGVTAEDRVAAVAAAIRPGATRSDLVVPGSVFPVRAGERGVFSRRRRIEAAVDLAHLAGSPSSTALLFEILDHQQRVIEDGDREMEVIPFVSVEDVFCYRRIVDPAIAPPVVVQFPTVHGLFWAAAYDDSVMDVTHVAVWPQNPRTPSAPPGIPRYRVHTTCPLGDALGACPDCSPAIAATLDDLGSGRIELLIYKGSVNRWDHLFRLAGRQAPDDDVRHLQGYGVVERILDDFINGASPR